MDYANKEFGIKPNDDYNRSNKYNYDTYIQTCLNNISIFKSMIEILDEKKQLENIKKSINETTDLLINSYSTTRGSYGYYVKDLSLTDEAKASNRKNCSEYCKLIDDKLKLILEKENAAKREKEAAQR